MQRQPQETWEGLSHIWGGCGHHSRLTPCGFPCSARRVPRDSVLQREDRRVSGYDPAHTINSTRCCAEWHIQRDRSLRVCYAVNSWPSTRRSCRRQDLP